MLYNQKVNLFTELKRRGVLRVAIAYTVSAWLLVQVADTVLPAFNAPEWSMRIVIILLGIGFPVTLLVSWLFDLTSKGFVRAEDVQEDTQPKRGSGLANIIVTGLLAAAVILFSLDKFVWNSKLVPGNIDTPQAIAVLPFENLSSDSGNDAFTLGIHDDLLTQLSKIKSFKTLSRTSMLRFAGSQKPIPEIASVLDVTVVLEGGVQRSADRVRINAQLIDGATDTHLWAETYDRQLSVENIFSIQSEIARAIASAMEATLSADDDQRLDQVPTSSLAAYDAYVAGLSSLDAGGVEDFDRAVAHFQTATELDPRFASAWAGLCDAQLSRFQKSSDRTQFDAAEAACQQALELDNTRVEVHIALGTLYRYFGQYARAEVALQSAHYAKAEQALEQALSLDSLTIDAMVELGNVLARQNRLDEAEAELKKAEALDARDYGVLSALFSFYYVYSIQPDRFDKAANYAARLTSLRPDLPSSWNNLGTAHFMLNRYIDAANAWTESLNLKPTRTGYTNTGLALYYAGRFQESAEMQRKATSIAPNDHRAWGRLGDALRHMPGQAAESIATYKHAAELAIEFLQVNDQDWQTRGLLAVYLSRSGQALAADEAIKDALASSGRRSEILFYAAQVALMNGDSSDVLDLLEETVSQNQDYRHLIANDSDFDGLDGNPRFDSLVGEI